MKKKCELQSIFKIIDVIKNHVFYDFFERIAAFLCFRQAGRDNKSEDCIHLTMPDIMQEPITVFSEIPAGKARLGSLIHAFEERYGHKASYVARAPGRVGERGPLHPYTRTDAVLLCFPRLLQVSIIGGGSTCSRAYNATN
jgi:hypothetical protein